LRSAIAAIGAPSTLLVGADATEARFRGQPLSQYRYLSFATHGLIREEISGLREAALVLTPGAMDDTFDDGLLTASELADLPLSADFVALSACNTANFDLAAFSADVPGLATALAIAGVPATLATLWPVDSMTSGRVVAEVFAQLGRTPQLHPAIALAQAQRQYLENLPRRAYAHPRFWAPFVVLGDSNYAHGGSGQATGSQVAVEGLRIQTAAGGEILAAATDRSGGAVASAMAEWNGQRFAGSFMRMSPDGALLWKKDRYDIGAGKVAVPSGDGAIVAGYATASDPEDAMSAVIALLNRNGEVISQLRLAQSGMRVFPAGSVALPDGTTLIAFSMTGTSSAVSGTSQSDQRALRVNRYSRELKPLGGVDLPLAPSAVTATTSIFSAGRELYVAAVDPIYSRKISDYADVLQNRQICTSRPQTRLFVLDSKSLATERTSWIADSSIAGFFAGADGTVFAVGSETACDGGTRLVLWRIIEDEMQVVFREDSIVSTKGRHGIQLPNGSILLVGTSKRVTDISRHEERQPDPDKYSDFSPSVSYSVKETDDLLALVISPEATVTARVVVPFGGDVYVNGLLRTGWGLSVYGAVAGQGALIDLKVPEQ
jgi:hypothetical protein